MPVRQNYSFGCRAFLTVGIDLAIEKIDLTVEKLI